MSAAPDRHLLFGLLALQNGLIDQGRWSPLFRPGPATKPGVWPTTSKRGDLTGPKRAALEVLASAHLETHGGDVEQSLAAIPANRSTRAGLAELGEPEIEATLARVARNKNGHATEADLDHDPDRTGTLAVGGSTGDGQRFQLLRPHARGGLGEVFVALDSELHREVALKQILEKHADDPVSRQRFVLEAEVTGGLEHSGDRAGLRPGHLRQRPPVLRHAFHQGRQPQGGDRAVPPRDNPLPWDGKGGGRPNPGRDLALRKLLRRFLDVCNAIDYAHSAA